LDGATSRKLRARLKLGWHQPFHITGLCLDRPVDLSINYLRTLRYRTVPSYKKEFRGTWMSRKQKTPVFQRKRECELCSRLPAQFCSKILPGTRVPNGRAERSQFWPHDPGSLPSCRERIMWSTQKLTYWTRSTPKRTPDPPSSFP
jgi:hypothetical protein